MEAIFVSETSGKFTNGKMKKPAYTKNESFAAARTPVEPGTYAVLDVDWLNQRVLAGRACGEYRQAADVHLDVSHEYADGVHAVHTTL